MIISWLGFAVMGIILTYEIIPYIWYYFIPQFIFASVWLIVFMNIAKKYKHE